MCRERIEQAAAWIKFGVLAGTIAYFLVTRDMLVYRYVEPFWMFGLFGATPMWVGLGVLLLATLSLYAISIAASFARSARRSD